MQNAMLRLFALLVFIFFAGPACVAGQMANYTDSSEENINQIDANGLKTGYWVIKGHMVNSTNYKPDQKIEEGTYVENKRHGLWKKYHTNGKLKSEITYYMNRPKGSYKLYYPSGVLEEDGNWDDAKNVGEYKRFHPNGKTSQDFHFEPNGLRTGIQKYYYENGNLELEVEIKQGLEQGLMRRYYPNGDLMEEKILENGVVKKGSVKKYEQRSPEVKVVETPAVPLKHSVRNTEDKPNLEVFKFNGKNTLYNKNRQVTQSGEFRDGRLWNGKWYRYNNDGLLEKIEVYREGTYIGNAPITDDDR
jgi:antitoxin component YwqK of YwqJK toxin-antitoxin module